MQMVVFLLDRKKVIYGVRQGLILDPLLFLIYINDLSKTTDNYAKVVLFTDDTSFLVTNSNQGGTSNSIKQNTL